MFSTLVLGLAMSFGGSEKDIVYSVVGGAQVKADFYAPELRNSKGDPFVLVVHGGGWTGGKKEDMAMLCEELAKVGIASATVDYRLAPQSKYPAQLDDVQTAVRFFRAKHEKYGIRTDKIAAAGASAGGHLSLLLGFRDTKGSKLAEYPDQSSKVQFVLNLFGPTDLRFDFASAVAGLISLQVTGMQYDPTSEMTKNFSPVTYVDSTSAEVFTIHGEADPLVPVKQAKRLDEALGAAHVKHTMRLIPGMKHEINTEIPEMKTAVAEALKFLVDRLGEGQQGSSWSSGQ
ncbi:MAG: alpha/beta hydrolase fold domain-containing protein [Fimbriimonadaceae bacterium]